MYSYLWLRLPLLSFTGNWSSLGLSLFSSALFRHSSLQASNLATEDHITSMGTTRQASNAERRQQEMDTYIPPYSILHRVPPLASSTSSLPEASRQRGPSSERVSGHNVHAFIHLSYVKKAATVITLPTDVICLLSLQSSLTG